MNSMIQAGKGKKGAGKPRLLESNTGRCTTRQYGLVGPRESEKKNPFGRLQTASKVSEPQQGLY